MSIAMSTNAPLAHQDPALHAHQDLSSITTGVSLGKNATSEDATTPPQHFKSMPVENISIDEPTMACGFSWGDCEDTFDDNFFSDEEFEALAEDDSEAIAEEGIPLLTVNTNHGDDEEEPDTNCQPCTGSEPRTVAFKCCGGTSHNPCNTLVTKEGQLCEFHTRRSQRNTDTSCQPCTGSEPRTVAFKCCGGTSHNPCNSLVTEEGQKCNFHTRRSQRYAGTSYQPRDGSEPRTVAFKCCGGTTSNPCNTLVTEEGQMCDFHTRRSQRYAGTSYQPRDGSEPRTVAFKCCGGTSRNPCNTLVQEEGGLCNYHNRR